MEFRDFIDELLARTDLVALISRYLPLTKKGDTQWGCCPFHHEKTPSFAVNEKKGFYHCFGCSESGNAITFLKKIENIEAGEAIRMLAAEAKMEMPKTEGKGNRADAVSAKKRERLYALMRDAAHHYHANLELPEAKKANDYLAARGIDGRLVRRFGLGYCLGWTQSLDVLRQKGYTYAEMKEAGIAEQKADRWYDVFSQRLMVPIVNNMGEVVAFGGRTLEPNPEFAKYRNSTQTLIFDKSRNIYGLNLLKKKKMRDGLDYIIMTEGYMDVIALHKAGFDTAVASMGTALTTAQARLLKNYCDRVYISYDGDGAGQKATLRGLDILAEAGLNVKVVVLPDGMDPDDVVKKLGGSAYSKMLAEALPLPEFKILNLKKQFNLSATDERAEFAVQAAKVVSELKNPAEQEEYMKIVQGYTGYSLETLFLQAQRAEAEKPAPRAEAEKPAQEGEQNRYALSKAAKFVLASMAHGMEYVDFTVNCGELFEDNPAALQIYGLAVEAFKKGRTAVGTLESVVDDDFVPLASELVGCEFLEGGNDVMYADCLKKLKIECVDNKINELKDTYKNSESKETAAAALTRISALNKKRTAIKNDEE